MTLYKSLIYDISKILNKHLNINEMARQSINRTIDKKLWLSVASTCSKNKSTDAEFIKPIGSDKNNLLQRYVAALLIMKKDCPKNENDINNIKTFKLIGKKYLDLGGTIEEIEELYNKNKFGISTNTNNINNTQETTQEDNTQEETTKKSSGGLFDDDFYDMFDDDDDITNTGDTMLANMNLPYDYSLEYILSKTLNITKPRGFKYYKYSKQDKRYDSYQYISSRSDYKFVQDFVTLIANNNWQCLYNKTYYNTISNSRQMTPEEEQQYLSLTTEYIGDYYIKNYWKPTNCLFAYKSPDNGLIFFAVRHKQDERRYSSQFSYILTFTGDVSYDMEFNNKDQKNIIKNIKDKDKKIRIFRNFICKYNYLKNWNYFYGMLDNDNYPYLYRSCSREYVIGQYFKLINATRLYKKNNANTNNIADAISKNNPYLHCYGYYDNDHKYSINDACVFIIELTEEGKKAFDKFEKTGSV